MKNDKKHLKNYWNSINDTISNVCVSCNGLWFTKSVKYYNSEELVKHVSGKNVIEF